MIDKNCCSCWDRVNSTSFTPWRWRRSDEPTSNVDSINESIILVSHRESTMAIADRIWRVSGGRMVREKSYKLPRTARQFCCYLR